MEKEQDIKIAKLPFEMYTITKNSTKNKITICFKLQPRTKYNNNNKSIYNSQEKSLKHSTQKQQQQQQQH